MLDNLFLFAAVVGGTVMVCQFALTLIGMGHDIGDGIGDAVDFHGDFHGDAHLGGDSMHGGSDAGHHSDSSWLFSVLSFRTLIAAIAFFGVAGKAASSAGLGQPRALAIALGAGVAAMFGMYHLMRAISRLNSSGNERIGNAIGRSATVYVPIPAGGLGAGKVQMSMQNRIVEFQAVTDESERLKTGEPVEVVAVTGSDMVCVRRAAQPVQA